MTPQRMDGGPVHTDVDDTSPSPAEGAAPGSPPLRLAGLVGLSLVVVLGALCGWLGFQAAQARRDAELRAVLVQAAKQEAVNLTTIDYEHAERDVQRILDSATDEFHDDFQNRSAPFIDVVKQAKSRSAGAVTEAGLESLNGRRGQVLVSVTVKTTSDGKPDEQPRYWRMRITAVQQDGGAKISNVEFVP